MRRGLFRSLQQLLHENHALVRLRTSRLWTATMSIRNTSFIRCIAISTNVLERRWWILYQHQHGNSIDRKGNHQECERDEFLRVWFYDLSKCRQLFALISPIFSITERRYVCQIRSGAPKSNHIEALQAPSSSRFSSSWSQWWNHGLSSEAIWRIFSHFPIHNSRYPTVTNLAVHLENGQRVYFIAANATQHTQMSQRTHGSVSSRLA